MNHLSTLRAQWTDARKKRHPGLLNFERTYSGSDDLFFGASNGRFAIVIDSPGRRYGELERNPTRL